MHSRTTTMEAADAGRQFHELLERHRKIVFKVANTYSRDAHDRADLAQEIAMQLWRAFPSWDGQRPFSTWMYRIALNVAISFVRSESLSARHSEPLDLELHDTVGNDDDAAEQDERVRVLQRFTAGLDPLNRALLLLYLDEHSHREIADVLGITETNVATRIGRLKQRLRDGLAET